jgi:hypothetical protein
MDEDQLINEAFEQLQNDPKATYTNVNWAALKTEVLTRKSGERLFTTMCNKEFRLHVAVYEFRVVLSLWSTYFHTSPQVRVRVTSTVGKFLDAVD